MFQPVIKWSGSKRSQCEEIIKNFPKEIKTYYEPFCGGASVMRALMESSEHNVKKYVISDLNSDLMSLWNYILNKPYEVVSHYRQLWYELNETGKTEIEKQLYFNEVRERYNKYRNPLDFMFLMRTCYNGMPRYNSKGEFNTSFHLNRKGIDPSTLQKIVSEWSILIDLHDVEFRCCSYEKIKPSEKDFMYIDPPYANTKGIYFDDFKNDSMFEWMKNLKCGWALSYDGISGEDNKTYEVPSELYTEHKYIKSGNSSFKRLIQSSNSAVVYESLYVKS